MDDRVLAPTALEQRLVAATLLSMPAQFELTSYGAADSHLHSLVVCGREAAGQFARILELRLHAALSLLVPFEAARIRPIESQRHLGSVFFYALRQEEHHRIRLSPYHDANALPDLLGLRVGGAPMRQRVAKFLPRVTRQSLRDLLPAGALQVEPNLAHLEEASLSAFALPHLRGSRPQTVSARRAAIQVVGDALPVRELCDRLDISDRTVTRLRSEPQDPRALYAVRSQMRLRTAMTPT